jgi:hypothetical protein
MSTKRESIDNPNSFLNRAGENEPVFVLRANDKCAPHVIRAWANAYCFEKGGVGKMGTREIGKYNDALDAANRMENWRRATRR